MDNPSTLLGRYHPAIGTTRQDLATPALILDSHTLRRNINFMQEQINAMSTCLRPHIKVHKSTDLARLQVEAGAIGVTTATAWETVVMANAGIEDILLANQIYGPEKIGAVAAAAAKAKVTVAVDNAANIHNLSSAALATGKELEIVVELDVGMGRGGARSPRAAVDLCRQIDAAPSLRFRGMMGYEGHCMLEPDRSVREEKTRTAMEYLLHTVDLAEEEGFASEVVSAGGTGTYDITGMNPRVTELQAGSYVFMDAFHGALVPGFPVSLTVLSTVIGRHDNTIILDAGRKSIGVDYTDPIVVGDDTVTSQSFAEEHALIEWAGPPPYDCGDKLELMAGYAPTTVNLYDVLHVLDDGRVVDLWPIHPRGPEHKGLIPHA